MKADDMEDRPALSASLRMLRTMFRDLVRAGDRQRAEQLLEQEISARHFVEGELHEKEAQIRAARRVQEHLLPRLPPSVAGFDIAGASYSSDGAAGDYFDYVPMLDGAWMIAVGDVSGHQFASALLMASARAYVRSLAQMHTNVADILTLANAVLLDDVEEDHFVTLFVARLNPLTHAFTYASAGHEPCYLLDRRGLVRSRLESTGFPLGITGEGEYLTAGPYTLEPGDLLLMITDGVHDVRSPEGVPFGTERMLEVVGQYAACSAEVVVAHLRDAVFSFTGDRKLDDDVTVVVVKAAIDP
jgi:serine phosphatase RsbU (regulator of sigma subunit)